MIRRMLVPAVVAAILMTAAPAQAATVEPLTYQRAYSVEWHWYQPGAIRVWFTRVETERTYRKLVESATLAGVASMLCEFIKTRWLERLCRASAALSIGNMVIQIREAHRLKVCLTARLALDAIFRGGVFDARGGKRCK